MSAKTQDEKDCDYYFNLYRRMERENRELRGRVAELEKEKQERIEEAQNVFRVIFNSPENRL